MTTPARADIASLFAPAGANEAFRQGVITAFNAATGANTVQVGGAVLTNLPILVGGDTVNYGPGDVVILLKFRSSWAILGRIVIPGNEALNASAIGFAADTVGASNYTIDTFGSATPRLKVTSTIDVPVWANSAAVLAMAICVGKQPTTPVPAGSVMTTHVLIDGDTDPNNPQGWVESLNNVVSSYPKLIRVITPGATITTDVEVWAGANWGSNTSNYTRLQVLALFRKV